MLVSNVYNEKDLTQQLPQQWTTIGSEVTMDEGADTINEEEQAGGNTARVLGHGGHLPIGGTAVLHWWVNRKRHAAHFLLVSDGPCWASHSLSFPGGCVECGVIPQPPMDDAAPIPFNFVWVMGNRRIFVVKMEASDFAETKIVVLNHVSVVIDGLQNACVAAAVLSVPLPLKKEGEFDDTTGEDEDLLITNGTVFMTDGLSIYRVDCLQDGKIYFVEWYTNRQQQQSSGGFSSWLFGSKQQDTSASPKVPQIVELCTMTHQGEPRLIVIRNNNIMELFCHLDGTDFINTTKKIETDVSQCTIFAATTASSRGGDVMAVAIQTPDTNVVEFYKLCDGPNEIGPCILHFLMEWRRDDAVPASFSLANDSDLPIIVWEADATPKEAISLLGAMAPPAPDRCDNLLQIAQDENDDTVECDVTYTLPLSSAHRVVSLKGSPLLLQCQSDEFGNMFVAAAVFHKGSAIATHCAKCFDIKEECPRVEFFPYLNEVAIVPSWENCGDDEMFGEGQHILNSIPRGLELFQSALQDILTIGGKAALSSFFAEISAQYHFTCPGPTRIDVGAQIMVAIESVFAQIDIGLPPVNGNIRSFVFSATIQEIASRIAFLTVCHVAWICSNTQYLNDPILFAIQEGFDLLVASLRAASALKQSLATLPEDEQGCGLVSKCLDVLFNVHRGEQTMPVGVTHVAAQLMNLTESPNLAARACEAWCSIWRYRFPVLYHFAIIDILQSGRCNGATSNEILSHSLAVASFLSSCPLPVRLQLLQIPVVSGEGSNFACSVADDLDRLITDYPLAAGPLYRVLLLTRLISMDSEGISQHVSLDVIERSFLADVSAVRHLIRGYNRQEDFHPSAIEEVLESIRTPFSILSTRAAIDLGDYRVALGHLATLRKAGDLNVVARYVEKLVGTAMGARKLKELSQVYLSDGTLIQQVGHEMKKQVIREVRNYYYSRGSGDERKELMLIEDGIAVHSFFFIHSLFDHSVKAVYLLAAVFHSINPTKRTSKTYDHIVHLLSLVVTTLEFAAKNLKACRDPEMEQHPNFTVFARNLVQVGTEYLPLLEEAKRDLLQSQAERIILAKKLTLPEVLQDCRPVLRKLLELREWEWALQLAKTFHYSLDEVFLPETQDLLEGPVDSTGWQKLCNKVVKHSNVDNSFHYLHNVVRFGLASERFKSFPQLLKDTLAARDPNALLLSYLNSEHFKSSKTLIVEGFEFVIRVLRAQKERRLEGEGFPELSVLTLTALDRVVDVAEKVTGIKTLRKKSVTLTEEEREESTLSIGEQTVNPEIGYSVLLGLEILALVGREQEVQENFQEVMRPDRLNRMASF